MPFIKKDLSVKKTDHLPQILEKSAGLEEVLKNLNQNGSHLWKVRSPSKRLRRKYFLDLSSMNVKYESPIKKKSCIPSEKPYIDITEIHDVRSGWKTDMFNKVCANEVKKAGKPGYQRTCEENNCFSIIHGPKMETLDLVAPDEEVADKWVRSLQYLISWYKSKEQEKSYENWLRKKFMAADLDRNKCLTFREVLKLLSELNVNMSQDRARKLFNEANTNRATSPDQVESLDEDEFVIFYFRLLQRPELEKIFGSYGSNGAMSADQLCQFLQKEQGGYENVTEEDCKAVIDIYEQSDLKLQGLMSSSGFRNMLLSQNFELFNKDHRKIHQDMTQPLSHYYIATSHNTYLLGHQLTGDSSVEAYINALRRGCRFLELDIWDGDDGEPVITHGFTFTTKILFKEVLDDALKPYAFEKSNYPVVLSLENHCSPPFQEKVAKHLRKILGDMVYTEDVTEDMQHLPSPEELKNKFIVKAKKIKPKTEKGNPKYSRGESRTEVVVEGSSTTTTTTTTTFISTTTSNDEVDTNESKSVETKTVTGFNSNPTIVSAGSLDEEESSSEEEESADVIDGPISKKKDAQVTSFELNSMINIMQSYHLKSFLDSKLNGKCYHMSSIAESKAMKLIQQSGADFVEFNKHKISKIFPSGARTGSSNFDPMPFWCAGCQCLALNYQTEDLPNFFNDAWFSENGACGVVLKPEFLRNPNMRFDPTDVIVRPKVVLKLRVISAQHLPKVQDNPSDIVDPYVEIKVVGIEQDSFIKHQTHTINNNGFNPVWDAAFDIPIRCPELAMLYFCVKDRCQTGTDEPLAYYAIPFGAIATGYRHIALVNLRGVPLSPSTLFVHVKMK